MKKLKIMEVVNMQKYGIQLMLFLNGYELKVVIIVFDKSELIFQFIDLKSFCWLYWCFCLFKILRVLLFVNMGVGVVINFFRNIIMSKVMNIVWLFFMWKLFFMFGFLCFLFFVSILFFVCLDFCGLFLCFGLVFRFLMFLF